jgi:hypothetical protein
MLLDTMEVIFERVVVYALNIKRAAIEHTGKLA